MKCWLIAALACACDRRPPIASCADDLTGEYANGEQRWMILDHRGTLEIYPLFPDVPDAGGLEVAPRAIDLVRTGTLVRGEVRRRYMQAAAMCTAKVPARVTACANDGIDIVLAETSPPLGFAPCTWPRPEPSRRERWSRR